VFFWLLAIGGSGVIKLANIWKVIVLWLWLVMAFYSVWRERFWYGLGLSRSNQWSRYILHMACDDWLDHNSLKPYNNFFFEGVMVSVVLIFLVVFCIGSYSIYNLVNYKIFVCSTKGYEICGFGWCLLDGWA